MHRRAPLAIASLLVAASLSGAAAAGGGGDDAYLRNLWSEMRLAAGGAGQAPTASLRPLWFKADAVPLQRVP